VRRRLVIAIAAVAAVAVLLLAVPLGAVLSRHYRDENLLRLQRDAVAATREIDVPRTAGDRFELPRSSDTLAVYDRDARRIAGTGPAHPPDTVRRALRTGRPADASGNGRLTVAAPLLVRERVTGVLLAQRSDAEAARDARGAWLLIGAVALGIIAAAIVAALLLGRRLARPLERVAAAARRLGDGDFSVRSERTGIPEVDEVGAALDATAARLDDLVRRERSFSADASHQLRTPLQALRIELEAIELRGDAPEEILAALAQVDRLGATIDTLLAVARDADRRDAVADLGALLDDAESRWRGALAAESRPLRVRVPAHAARARASGPVVREVVDVLIANAEHHGEGAVTLSLQEHDGWLALDVTDEGPGFAEPERAFLRGAAAGNGPGHGIGLALARSLAEAEGGSLTIAEPGPRPTVRLMLEAARGPVREGSAPRPGPSAG
jgi:signal transduction histidine kinase